MSEPKKQLVNEHECATAVGMSVEWMRKDRQRARIVPFIKLGGAVRYDMEKVFAALAAHTQGGKSV